MKIDLNSDLGEGFGPWKMGDDDALLGIVTSANVACGYHAGDPVIMDRTVRAALANKVDLGAHVSFPDLAGFGRRPMRMDARELELHIIYQLGALDGIARGRSPSLMSTRMGRSATSYARSAMSPTFWCARCAPSIRRSRCSCCQTPNSSAQPR